jgi:hypothetical protein
MRVPTKPKIPKSPLCGHRDLRAMLSPLACSRTDANGVHRDRARIHQTRAATKFETGKEPTGCSSFLNRRECGKILSGLLMKKKTEKSGSQKG